MSQYFSQNAISDSYHQFSDTLALFNLPNARNVLSNMVLLIPAIYLVMNRKFNQLVPLILGLALSSSYYHLNPNKQTILLDMVFVITLNTVILSYFVNKNTGYIIILLGLVSVLYWNQTQNSRPYVSLQILIFMYCVYKVYPTNAGYLLLPLLIISFMTRFSEVNDKEIYETTNHLLSGHSLKHVFAGIQIFIIIFILEKLNKI